MLEGQEVNDILLTRIRKFAEQSPAPELLLERNSFRNLRQGLLNGHYDIIATLSFEVDSLPGVCHRSILRQPGHCNKPEKPQVNAGRAVPCGDEGREIPSPFPGGVARGL